jgi:hypothetical protein
MFLKKVKTVASVPPFSYSSFLLLASPVCFLEFFGQERICGPACFVFQSVEKPLPRDERLHTKKHETTTNLIF